MSISKTFPNAAVLGGAPKLQALLATGANVHEIDVKGRTALFRTCRVGHTEKVLMLLAAGADPNATDHRGEAPLQTAARYGHLDCVRALLKAGAAINYCPSPSLTDYSESALCSAARECAEAARLLLESGADPNVVTESKKYPLMSAIRVGDEELVRQLLAHNANLDITDTRGRTPLHRAVEARKPNLVKLLLELGANPNVKDGRGDTPLFAAIARDEKASLSTLRQLLTAKPNLSTRNLSHQMTALEYAIFIEATAIAEVLRGAGSPAPRKSEPDHDDDSLTITIDLDDVEQAENLEDSEDVAPEENDWRYSIEPVDEQTLLPTAQDIEWAAQVDREVPSVFAALGHRVSKPHWDLLRHAVSPMSLNRMAYCARGSCNRPPGQEMEDGKKVLGEPYESAAARFVAQGLLRQVIGPKAINLALTVSDLSAIAKQHRIKASGSKNELTQRLFSTLGEDPFAEKVRAHGGYFELTPLGVEEASRFQNERAAEEVHQKQEILEALIQEDFLRAVKSARILALLKNPLFAARMKFDPERIALARFIRSCRIPSLLRFSPGSEARCLAISSARALCGELGGAWDTWDSSIEPPKTMQDQPVSLSVFSAGLLGHFL